MTHSPGASPPPTFFDAVPRLVDGADTPPAYLECGLEIAARRRLESAADFGRLST